MIQGRNDRAVLLSVQYLRFAAALAVTFFHTGIQAGNFAWPTSIPRHFGACGVDLFFVVSGFVIVLTTSGKPTAGGEFMLRRFERVVPLYWGATLAVVALALLLPSLFRTTNPTALGVAESLFFIPSEAPKAPLLGVGWTLDYEIFFYLLFACLSDFASETRTFAICTLMAGLMLIGQTAPHETALEYFYTSPSLLGFALGTVLAQAHRHGLMARLARLPAWAVIMLALALTVLFFAIPATEAEDRAPFYFHLAMSAAAIAIVGGGLVLESARRLKPHALLHYLGDASYSIYLFHLFAVGAGWAVAHRLWPESTAEYLMVALATGAVALSVALQTTTTRRAPSLSSSAATSFRQPGPLTMTLGIAVPTKW